MNSVPVRAVMHSASIFAAASRYCGTCVAKREIERPWSWFSRKTVPQASVVRIRSCVFARASLNSGSWWRYV